MKYSIVSFEAYIGRRFDWKTVYAIRRDRDEALLGIDNKFYCNSHFRYIRFFDCENDKELIGILNKLNTHKPARRKFFRNPLDGRQIVG